jgi:HAMP domain-containing protein
MFDSLKNQIIAVIAILISIILLQVYFSRATQSELIQSQESSNHSYANVALVHELERDIIDLQRHLHIHKETASTSAIARFYELMTRVKEKLSLFENDSKIVFIKTLELSLLDNMRKHLNDYEENFNSVINWRSQRKVIFNDNIQFNLKQLDQIIKQYESKENTKNNTSDLALKYHLAMAEKSINQYLIFPDSEHIREINQQLTSAKMVIPKNFNEHKQATALINAVKKDFIRLSQITRGYIFLVNVVMAGSANEFLYLTKKLRETVLDEQLTLSEESKIKTEQEQIKTIVIAIISIIITLLVALFILSRMIKPIRNITDVFAKLADGEALLEIPGINRRDEIGNLAKAANVFRDKNRQTLELLSSAQYMNNAQKALNRELKIAKKKAELAAESKSMFLANMSHEIRTPMNGIIGLIELTRNTELNPQQAHHLQMAAYSGQVMMNVINDILDFSKIEAGKMEIEYVEFNID